MGIDSRTKLERFKSTVVKVLRTRGYKIAVPALAFNQKEAIAQVCDLISIKAVPVDPDNPLIGSAGLRERGKGGKAMPKAAKKKSAKKKSAKRESAARMQGFKVGEMAPAAKPRVGGAVIEVAPPAKRKSRPGPAVELAPPKSRKRTAGDNIEMQPLSSKGVKKASSSSKTRPGVGAESAPPDLPIPKIPWSGPVVDPSPDFWRRRNFPASAPEKGRRLGTPRPPLKGPVRAEEPEPLRTFECMPQLAIRKEIVRGLAYRMAVFVNQEPASPGAEVQPVKVEVPQSLKEFALDVWFDCSSHFSLDEIDDPSRIVVNTESGVSNELSFTVKVVKPPDDKPMYVSAFFRYNQRPSGKITRYLELSSTGLVWKQFIARSGTEGEVVLPKVDAPPSVVVESAAAYAEIRVEVLKTEANDGQHFTLKCQTPQEEWHGPWNLPQVSKNLVNEYMKNFMANTGKARIASLLGAGMDFWDTLPVKVKALLWEALQKNAATMSVISEEPYIPWEQMVPYQEVQNPSKPLGLALRFGRWVTGDYTSARQYIPMKNGYVVCPKTSGLTSAPQELAFLTQQLKKDFSPVDPIVPVSFDGLDTGLNGAARNVIHFICHGKSAALQTLELDRPDTLDCSQVRTLKGFQAALKDHPLVFLNACEVGGQVLALDGVGGFANSFIHLGAAAVIAPLWPVQDKVALDVTQTFYPLALQGIPFAEAMKRIRSKAYDQAIDSYAAYCFYGDPMACTAPHSG
jgi:hypothetical protein